MTDRDGAPAPIRSPHPRLGPRLAALRDAVVLGAPVVDIGCHHGLVGLRLLVDAAVPHVTFVDRSRVAIAQLAAKIVRYDRDGTIARRARLLVADGRCLGGPLIGTVIVGGMGAESIRHILERAVLPGAAAALRLVLQPSRDDHKVIAVLEKCGASPRRSLVCDRGRAHVVLVADVSGLPTAPPSTA